MQKNVRFATIEDFDFIYDALRKDLEEQGVRCTSSLQVF